MGAKLCKTKINNEKKSQLNPFSTNARPSPSSLSSGSSKIYPQQQQRLQQAQAPPQRQNQQQQQQNYEPVPVFSDEELKKRENDNLFHMWCNDHQINQYSMTPFDNLHHHLIENSPEKKTEKGKEPMKKKKKKKKAKPGDSSSTTDSNTSSFYSSYSSSYYSSSQKSQKGKKSQKGFKKKRHHQHQHQEMTRSMSRYAAPDALAYKIVLLQFEVNGKLVTFPKLSALLTLQIPHDARIVGDSQSTQPGSLIAWHRDGLHPTKKYACDRMQTLGFYILGPPRSVVQAMAVLFRYPESLRLKSFKDGKTTWSLLSWTRLENSNAGLTLCRQGLHFTTTPQGTKTYWDIEPNGAVASMFINQKVMDTIHDYNSQRRERRVASLSSLPSGSLPGPSGSFV